MGFARIDHFRTLLARGHRMLSGIAGKVRRPAPAIHGLATLPSQAPSLQPRPSAVVRPLRIVRVVDASQGRAQAGRMVISGRLADVCAELERLAAQESDPRGTALARAA